jgi:hypothetical protein
MLRECGRLPAFGPDDAKHDGPSISQRRLVRGCHDCTPIIMLDSQSSRWTRIKTESRR